MSSMADMTLSEFAESLAAKRSVPAGGSACAYAGALAAALCSMTGSFTAGKERYAAYEQDVRRMIGEADEVSRSLLELADEDGRALVPLLEAYKLPKGDPGRAAEIERAAKAACEVPLEMMRQLCRAIDLLGEMEEKGSVLLRSDVGCGAALAKGALEAAGFNVLVNAKGLEDADFAAAALAERRRMLEGHGAKAASIEARVMRDLERKD